MPSSEVADIYLFLQTGEHDDCELGCKRHWVLVFHYKDEGRIIMYDCYKNVFDDDLHTHHRIKEQVPPICRDIRLVVCDFPVTPEEMENAAIENIFNGEAITEKDFEGNNTPVCIKWVKTLCSSRGIPFEHMSKCEETPVEAYAVDPEGNFVCVAVELFNHHFLNEINLS